MDLDPCIPFLTCFFHALISIIDLSFGLSSLYSLFLSQSINQWIRKRRKQLTNRAGEDLNMLEMNSIKKALKSL